MRIDALRNAASSAAPVTRTTRPIPVGTSQRTRLRRSSASPPSSNANVHGRLVRSSVDLGAEHARRRPCRIFRAYVTEEEQARRARRGIWKPSSRCPGTGAGKTDDRDRSPPTAAFVVRSVLWSAKPWIPSTRRWKRPSSKSATSWKSVDQASQTIRRGPGRRTRISKGEPPVNRQPGGIEVCGR